MATDPKIELRQLLADRLLARWVEEGYAGNTPDLPYEGQCEQIAGWVVDLFTVGEDYQAIEDRRLGKPTPDHIWNRRLVAATEWQPTQEPAHVREDREDALAYLRANGIDTATVLASPGPDIDPYARTISVHHLPPQGTGCVRWRQTYSMKVSPEEWREQQP